MNTIENNKLIAEFMGLDVLYNDMVKHESCRIGHVAPMQYNCSWDWLMPVVEKIETSNYSFKPTLNKLTIERNLTNSIIAPFDFYDHSTKEHVFHFDLERTGLKFGGERFKTKIEAVYNAVIEFIKWYNQQPKGIVVDEDYLKRKGYKS